MGAAYHRNNCLLLLTVAVVSWLAQLAVQLADWTACSGTKGVFIVHTASTGALDWDSPMLAG